MLPPFTLVAFVLVYAPQMQGDDSFRIYAPEYPGIVNLNDDDNMNKRVEIFSGRI